MLQFLQAAMGVEIPAYVLQFGRSMGMLLSEMSTLNKINEHLFLQSQPGFSVSARRYKELAAAIGEAEAEYRLALKKASKQALTRNAIPLIGGLMFADSSEESAKHALQSAEAMKSEAAEATQQLKARLDALNAELSELRTKAGSGLPSVDGQALIARDLSQNRNALLGLVGVEFAARMQFDALGTNQEEAERMLRTSKSQGVEDLKINLAAISQFPNDMREFHELFLRPGIESDYRAPNSAEAKANG
jgi:chromosome segregation ATPase